MVIIVAHCGCRYPLYGGMQDWNYLHAGCLDITIEVAENKWPPPEQVTGPAIGCPTRKQSSAPCNSAESCS